MGEFVRSLGGPLVVMDLATWRIWGGNSGNTATRSTKTDYDFACQSRGYVSTREVAGRSILILNDMPMDTWVVRHSVSEVLILRIMNGDIDDCGSFLSDHTAKIFRREHALGDEFVQEFVTHSDALLLVDASATALSLKENDCLEFKLKSGSFAISTYDYSDEMVRVIIHKFERN